MRKTTYFLSCIVWNFCSYSLFTHSDGSRGVCRRLYDC